MKQYLIFVVGAINKFGIKIIVKNYKLQSLNIITVYLLLKNFVFSQN
jgi:hypothetical protein